jgi:hypothetical protein
MPRTYSRNNFKFRHDFHIQLLHLHNEISEIVLHQLVKPNLEHVNL